MKIRPATHDDATAICAIWNPIIIGSSVTFNTVEKSTTDVINLISERNAAGHGFFVAESTEALLGFASYAQFRNGVGYSRTMEHTVILRTSARGNGVGRTLMGAVETHAKHAGAHSMLGGISAENLAAIAFHSKVGYLEVGNIPAAGHKFGRFIDLILMQKLL